MKEWSKEKGTDPGTEGDTEEDIDTSEKSYLQQCVNEADVTDMESSSKFNWILPMLRDTTHHKIIIFSSW